MAEMTIRLRIDPNTGKKDIIVSLRAEGAEPEGEPAPLEPGVPGDQDAAPGERGAHAHTFHGAFPDAHSSFRARYSR